ncbi:MAG: nucleotidyltransferase [Syntrophales bacterium]|jgi:hypothetical protein
MADVQKYLEQFHVSIRMDYDMSSTLREKRDIILRRVRKYLSDNELPGFSEMNQGSYIMKTGVKPIGDLEYDIDVALRFSFKDDEYSATEVRKWVYEAVKNHTESVEDRGPCIRVTYADGYHVDLVTYAMWEDQSNITQYRLAHKKNGWRPSEPAELINYIRDAMERFEGTNDSSTSTNQFRRVVRYLRRWIDEAIPYESDSKPTGLGFVLLADKYLTKKLDWTGKPDDRTALYNMIFTVSNIVGRIVVRKPTQEYEDMFAKLSDAEIKKFKVMIGNLAATLDLADNEPDPVKACEILREQFGSDFPVPDPEDTAKKTTAPAIVPSSSSA